MPPRLAVSARPAHQARSGRYRRTKQPKERKARSSQRQSRGDRPGAVFEQAVSHKAQTGEKPTAPQIRHARCRAWKTSKKSCEGERRAQPQPAVVKAGTPVGSADKQHQQCSERKNIFEGKVEYQRP